MNVMNFIIVDKYVLDCLAKIGYGKLPATYDEVLTYLKNKEQLEVYTKKDDMPEFSWNYGPVRNPIWCVGVHELYLPKNSQLGLIWESYYTQRQALDGGISKACEIILNENGLYTSKK
jgi:hypothetical protein